MTAILKFLSLYKPVQIDRGIGSVALKLLKIFTKKGVQKGVKELAADLEKKQLENKSGLFQARCKLPVSKKYPAGNNKPFLLFLHGTNFFHQWIIW